AYVAAVSIGVILLLPAVAWPAYWGWLPLVAVAIALWIHRRRTVVSPAGLSVRGMVGTRPVPWDAVLGLRGAPPPGLGRALAPPPGCRCAGWSARAPCPGTRCAASWCPPRGSSASRGRARCSPTTPACPCPR